jgi:hypothetical protein
MPIIKQLTQHYTELWKEYIKFLEMNKLNELNISKVYFIYREQLYNKGCLICNPKLTKEETCMYNYSVDDDFNRILVDNDYGTIYVKFKQEIIAFRCTNYCLKPQTYRFLNQWKVNHKNTSSKYIKLLDKL